MNRCNRMRHSYLIIVTLISGLIITGCDVLPEPLPVPDSVWGMSPSYADSTSGKTITTRGPSVINDGRAFAVLGDTIYIVDHLRGIHIIDNRMPQQPINISFIDIPGCTSVAINGRFLYVNNLTDLVTLDITDPNLAIEVDREEGLYPQVLDFPEGYVGYFTCYDPTQGYLTGWEEQFITLPDCFRE